MTKAALHTAQQDRLNAGEGPHQDTGANHGSIDLEMACPRPVEVSASFS
jgi:hypothetical protein